MAVFQINNFAGALTRKRFGPMNSGLVPIGKGHSVDPFTDPPSLVFNEAATDLDPTHGTVTDLVLDGVPVEEAGSLYIYAIDRSGNILKINTSTDAVSLIYASATTLKYGGGIRYMSSVSRPYLIVSHDTGAFYVKTDGSGRVDIPNTTFSTFMDTDVNTSNDTIALSSTVLATSMTGMGFTLVGGSTPPPAPLAYTTQYYLIVSDATHIQVATSRANALAGVAIDITTTGFAGGTFNYRIDNWIPNIPHPISDEFFGGIFIGNGPFLVDFAIASLIISNVSRLNPTFPNYYTITSVEVDGEGRYLRANATTGTTNDVIAQDPTAPTQAPVARSIYWNGVDTSYDSYDPFQQTNTSSSASFLNVDVSYGQDFWGSGMFQSSGGSVDKMAAMREVKAANQGSITSTGNLLLYAAPYYVQGEWRAGIFGFGKLDDEDQNAGYPLLAIEPAGNNTHCTAVGMLKLAQNRYLSEAGTALAQSKFYVGVYDTGGTAVASLYSFTLTPGGGVPNDGVYETQVERFTMMQQLDRVSFYMLPTADGVHFLAELVDADGTVPSGASFAYQYAAGDDETLLQGSLETFDWASPAVKNFQGLGLRITNLGTVQPRITQIYIETHDVDKGATPETPIPSY